MVDGEWSAVRRGIDWLWFSQGCGLWTVSGWAGLCLSGWEPPSLLDRLNSVGPLLRLRLRCEAERRRARGTVYRWLRRAHVLSVSCVWPAYPLQQPTHSWSCRGPWLQWVGWLLLYIFIALSSLSR